MSHDRAELKPCPFCGEVAWSSSCLAFGNLTIRCGNDDCPVGPETTYTTPEKAIAAWNTRAIDPSIESLQAEVERLREALDRIQGHSTERPCMTATEHTERTLDEVQQIARQALAAKEQTRDRD